jgi:hypothetical protein
VAVAVERKFLDKLREAEEVEAGEEEEQDKVQMAQMRPLIIRAVAVVGAAGLLCHQQVVMVRMVL